MRMADKQEKSGKRLNKRFFRGKGPPGGRFGGQARRAPESDGLTRIFGIHSVREALSNPRRKFIRLVATKNAALRLSEDGLMPVEPVIAEPDDIGRQLPPDAVHQGALLICEPLEPLELDGIGDEALVLALDQVTDPHNVGAILRSAAAFGVDAMIVTERHSPDVTAVLAKAASGGLEHVPFCPVRNLGDALEVLGKRGFLRIGLDSEAEAAISAAEARRPLVLVLGAEGRGLRQRTRGLCDIVARLDMPGAIKSLNVSNAAAIALYAVTERLRKD